MPNLPTTPQSPKHGEPWKYSPEYNDIENDAGEFVTLSGVFQKTEDRDRAIDCVSAMIGVPDPRGLMTIARQAAQMMYDRTQSGRDSDYEDGCDCDGCNAIRLTDEFIKALGGAVREQADAS